MPPPLQIAPSSTTHITVLGPALQYHGGDVIGSVQVQPIFWGAAWQTGTYAQIITGLNSFFDRILKSALIDMLAEYSTPSINIQHGSRLSSVIIGPRTTANPGSTVTDSQIQTNLQNWINTPGTVAAPTSNTLYFIYLPPGVTVIFPNSGQTFTSCTSGPQGICAYHSWIRKTKIFYAVVPYDLATCSNCATYGFDALSRITVVSSHELCESITNPDNQGWYDPNTGFEIGDICAIAPTGQNSYFNIGNDLVQNEWSNNRCGCLGSKQASFVPSTGFSNGAPINGSDRTGAGVAACEFLQHLFVFWKAADSSNSIWFSASPDGTNFPPGKPIPTSAATSDAPACCVFQGQIFVFWKANDSSNSIYFSGSSTVFDGKWSTPAKINAVDSSGGRLCACVFQNELFLFWPANDSSDSIYFSSSPTGVAGSWLPGQKINGVDITPKGLAACVLTQVAANLFLFWKGNDSDAIYYASSTSAKPGSWVGQRINLRDLTPNALGACVVCSRIYLFWQANDSSNSIYFAMYNDVTNTPPSPWPPGKKINNVDHTPDSPAACTFTGRLHVFWKGDDSAQQIWHSTLN